VLHWRGRDLEPPTSSHSTSDLTTPEGLFFAADRSVPGQDTVTWEAVFANGPAPIQDFNTGIMWMTGFDLSGTTFTFENPETGASFYDHYVDALVLVDRALFSHKLRRKKSGRDRLITCLSTRRYTAAGWTRQVADASAR
jgi:hypothetical protein